MKKGKRIFSKLVATLSILAILLGGTFAWYATTSAINRFNNIKVDKPIVPEEILTNLHDNFETGHGEVNKDVFVENTGTTSVFVRVTLSELIGAETETNKPTIRKANEAETGEGVDILAPGIRDDWFAWKLGGSVSPWQSIKDTEEWKAITDDTDVEGLAERLAKEELVADNLGGALTAVPADTGADGIPDRTNMQEARVINMKQYSLMTDEDKAGYVGWIYDTDGYAYWSQPLAPGRVTGLLLDLVETPDEGGENYSYDIIVNMEYVDATDLSAWMSNTKIKEGTKTGQDATTATDAAIDFLQGISGTHKNLGPADELADFIGGIEVAPNETVELPPTITVDGKEVDLTWKSDDPEVATVDENGNVTAVGPGDTVITGTDEHGNKVEIPIHVNPDLLNRNAISLTMDTSNKTVVVGGNLNAPTVTVVPENATNQTVVWISNNEAIAVVNPTTGQVTGVATGTTMIRVIVENADGSTATNAYVVTVMPPAPVVVNALRIEMDTTNKTVEVGQNLNIPTATVLPANATNKTIEWSSSNPTAVGVNALTGQVTGITPGVAMITGTVRNADGSSATTSYLVTVEAPAPVVVNALTIEMDTDNKTVEVDDTLNAPAVTVLPENATNKVVVWSSSNEAIATVNPITGQVTGVAPGTVTIIARVINADSIAIAESYLLTVTRVGPEPPTQGVGTVSTTRMLTAQQTGDGEWIEIARNGGYSLILRRTVIAATSRFSSTANYVPYADQPHTTGNLRFTINNWYSNTLSTAAPIRQYTVDHDALMKPGTASHLDSENGFSVPTGELRGTGSDVAFALSFQEAAIYVSGRWNNNISGGETWSPSSAEALINWNRLTDRTATSWLRTAGRSSTAASYLYTDNRVGTLLTVPHAFRVRPALWVDSAIFDQ